jgi:hypothetical protein
MWQAVPAGLCLHDQILISLALSTEYRHSLMSTLEHYLSYAACGVQRRTSPRTLAHSNAHTDEMCAMRPIAPEQILDD